MDQRKEGGRGGTFPGKGCDEGKKHIWSRFPRSSRLKHILSLTEWDTVLFCHFLDKIDTPFFQFRYEGEQEVANCYMLINQHLLRLVKHLNLKVTVLVMVFSYQNATN